MAEDTEDRLQESGEQLEDMAGREAVPPQQALDAGLLMQEAAETVEQLKNLLSEAYADKHMTEAENEVLLDQMEEVAEVEEEGERVELAVIAAPDDPSDPSAPYALATALRNVPDGIEYVGIQAEALSRTVNFLIGEVEEMKKIVREQYSSDPEEDDE